MNKAALLVLALCALAVGAMALLVSQRDQPRTQSIAPVALSSIEGVLDIGSIDDLRIAGRKILLCGVKFTKPRSMISLVTEAARQDFQGIPVRCIPVGAGTPCDGKVAAQFAGAPVVQCFTKTGLDIAAEFAKAGLLCGVPPQTGGVYQACRGS